MVIGKIVDKISQNLAFFPPSPPSYELDHFPDGHQELYIKPMKPRLKRVAHVDVHLIQPTSRTNLVLAVVKPPTGLSALSIIHSHGNAVDLGLMLPLYSELAKVLKCNVIGYDYRGYGSSVPGLPSATSTLADIKAVTDFVEKQYSLRKEDTILYGQSVGSGPTCWLAAYHPGFAGVVLHSAFLSGMRVLKPSWHRWPTALDIFPNHKLVPKIKCPLLVIHGDEDEVVPIDHGRQLASLCSVSDHRNTFWATRCNHQDVENHEDYVPVMRKFLKECFAERYQCV